MKRLALLFTASLVLIVAAPNLMSADQATQDLYKGKCQACHGADGKASAVGKKLGAKDFQDPDVAKESEADMANIIGQGKNKMPAYKDKLTNDQIKALASYIKEMK